MALNTFSGLKTAVANWTHRDDLYDIAPDFITLVENRLNRELRTSFQEERSTTTANEEYLAFPTDFLGIRNIQLNTNPVRELEYVTPMHLDFIDNAGDELKYYSIVGDRIQLQSTSSSTLEISYYTKISALSTENETNWVTENFPDVYLYGTLAEAFSYCQADDQANKYASLFVEAIQGIKSYDVARKAGQSLRVRVA